MATEAQKWRLKYLQLLQITAMKFLPAAHGQCSARSAGHPGRENETWCLKIPQNQAREHAASTICYHGDGIQPRCPRETSENSFSCSQPQGETFSAFLQRTLNT